MTAKGPSLLERLIGWWPDYGVNRSQKRFFEAAEPTNLRPGRGYTASGDALMQRAGPRLRNLSRWLDENVDLAVGVLDDLVDNIVGHGVRVEPMARLEDGALAEDTNRQLAELWEEWGDYPEVTEAFGMTAMERIIARHWLRDGEMFYGIIGRPSYSYQTAIPLVLELIEADLVPFDLTTDKPRITHGIERNAFGATVAYHVLKEAPGESVYYTGVKLGDTRRIMASRMHQLKFVRRFGQARGVPIFHSVVDRLRDIKEIEDSEQIAAKIGASVALALKRETTIPGVDYNAQLKRRELEFPEGGSILDLMPGETIDTVGQQRPNEKLVEFRASLMRAVAAGTSTRYSSISRDYNGTYSAQRQELVEASIGYRALFEYLRARFYRPVWRRFVEQVLFSGLLAPQAGTDLRTLYRGDFRPPALPWIDPKKEADAFKVLQEAKLESRAEIARMRGRDPRKLLEELEAENAMELFAPIRPQEPENDGEMQDDDESGSDDQQQVAVNE